MISGHVYTIISSNIDIGYWSCFHSPNYSDSSNKRESSGAVAPDKSTLWGNLKSFADGVLNIWRKLWSFVNLYGATCRQFNIFGFFAILWRHLYGSRDSQLFSSQLPGILPVNSIIFLAISFDIYPSFFCTPACCTFSNGTHLQKF
jgi:hypothetical protein